MTAVESPLVRQKPRAVPTRGWAKWLLPSFSDCFFIAMLVWLFLAGSEGWKQLLGDADTGWHIRTGEYVLAHHAVPTQDLYSFSKAGESWFAWEWLSDVVFALLHGQLQLKGVVLLAGVVIALYAAVLLRWMLWRNANLFAALVVTMLGIGASTIHFLARPHVFTLLFLTVSLWMLDRDRRTPGRMVWLLIPLSALWTNLHGGFLSLIACLGLVVAGRAIEGFLEYRTPAGAWLASRRYLLLFAGCSAATLINPYGLGLHTHIAQYLQSDWIRKVVQEFQAPDFRSEALKQFEVLLFLGLISVGLLLRKRHITDALSVVYFASMALGSVRHVPLFVIVAGPIIASELTSAWQTLAEGANRKSLVGILDQLARDAALSFRRSSVWGAVVVVALLFLNASLHWPADFPDVVFPVKMIQRHSTELVGTRVFTSDQWGDYMIYHYYPRHKVFVDGRSDFYGENMGEQYLAAVQGKYNWESVLERYRFQYALMPIDWPLAALLKRHSGWKVLDDDGHSILFEHLGPITPYPAGHNPYSGIRGAKETLSKGLMKTPVPAELVNGDPRA